VSSGTSATARAGAVPAWLGIEDVTCEIGGATVVDRVSFALGRGELGALLGPSGSGKTTVLRAIAGLMPVARGRIMLRGSEVSTRQRMIAPEARRIGIVFQDLALFPHLDVAGNIAFGLTRLDRARRTARVGELLERFELAALAHRRPHELSGGQQQRVAIARALAPGPDLLLLDEPFSSLDADLRARLRAGIRSILRELDVTALLVTHDHTEALGFADRVGVIVDGRLRQWDTPEVVFRRPADALVASFVGEGRLIDATADAEGRLVTAIGALEADEPAPRPGERRRVLVRPHEIEASRRGEGAAARVLRAEFAGADTLLEVETEDGTRLDARWRKAEPPRPGDVLWIAARPGRYPHYPKAQGTSDGFGGSAGHPRPSEPLM
jgi:iron(III) transport system ATP-binding protein